MIYYAAVIFVINDHVLGVIGVVRGLVERGIMMDKRRCLYFGAVGRRLWRRRDDRRPGAVGRRLCGNVSTLS